MSYLDNYRSRMFFGDDAVRERKVAEARKRAIKHFMQDPSAFTVTAEEPNGTKVQKRIRVINESVLKQLNPERTYSKFIVPHPDEPMKSGTILFGLYEVDWIVTAVTGLGDVHQQATLQKLNEVLSYKDEKGTVQELYAAVNGVSRLGDGILDMNLYMFPDEMIKVRVQSTEKTRGLKPNIRFKVADKYYTLVKVDSYTDEGIINWIARQDLEEHSDIAPPPPIPVVGDIVGSDKITRAKTYTYTAPEGVVAWSLSSNIVDNVVILESNSSSAVIRAEKTQLVKFTLSAEYADGTVKEKEIQIISLF